MEKINYSELLKRVLDVGEKMLVTGAEVNRVEDSMRRMFQAYDVEHIEIFIITSSMVVTIETKDGEIFTQTRSIKTLSIDLDKLDHLNDLSRQICIEKPSPDKIKKMFAEVAGRPAYSLPMRGVFAAVIAACFAVFFGGNVLDAIIAAGIGVLVILLEYLFRQIGTHEVVFYLMVSLFAGILTIIMVKLVPNTHVDMIMIGIIMLLIPGLVMTNALRDMIIGDTISGLLRLVQSLIIAAALAIGFGLAIYMLGGVL